VYRQDAHAKKNKNCANETVDTDGMHVEYANAVYINIVNIPTPAEVFAPSQSEYSEILRLGPFTRSYQNVVPILQPVAVKASTFLMWRHFGGKVIALAGSLQRDPARLTLAEMARGVLGRVGVHSPASYLDIRDPIPGCDTKSNDDMHKIMSRIEADTITDFQHYKLPSDGLRPVASPETTVNFDHSKSRRAHPHAHPRAHPHAHRRAHRCAHRRTHRRAHRCAHRRAHRRAHPCAHPRAR
jgi:hypothetical protein